MKKISALILSIFLFLFTQSSVLMLPSIVFAGTIANGNSCPNGNSDCVSNYCSHGICQDPPASSLFAGTSAADHQITNDMASGLIPCTAGYDPQDANSCGLPQLITLIKNIITALFVISIPIATIAFVYIGFTLLFSQGNVGKIQEAKRIAMMVLIGFIFILSAWLIVYTITSILLDPSFNIFLKP